MKKYFILLLLLFSVLNSFSQKDKNSDEVFLTKKILQTKTNDIFELRKITNSFSKISLDTLKKIDSLSQKENYKVGQIFALHLISVHYKRKHETQQALVILKKALEITKEINDTSSKILILNTIGTIYKNNGDIRNSINYYEEALSESAKIKKPSNNNKISISISKNSIGNIYLLLKQYDLALEQFEESLKLKKEINDVKGIAINYQNIGYVQEKLGDLKKALKNYKKSLTINTKNDNLLGTIICNNSICSILLKKEKVKEALRIAKKNTVKAKQLKNRKYYTKSITVLGWAYQKQGNISKAKEILEEAVMISDKYKYTDYFIESSMHLSEVYNTLNNEKKASYHYKKSVELDKKTSDRQNSLFIRNLIEKHNSHLKINQFRELENKIKIKTYESSRSRDILIIALVSFALLSVALYSIYRQRLVNNDKSILMLEQQALQAQMNPHFIFNALNSIKLYIINNDQKQAVYYLNKFSKLIRNILDVSKVKYVNLNEELKTMELYMSIENIRFNNEIKYSQNIHPNLNLEIIKLPPLVLQPFIENAIWHGLSSKKSDKKITLTASKISNNLIEISVTDNGIGRKAAEVIKKNKNRSLDRKSVGIDLTVERLETFSNEFIHNFELKYHDLKDDNDKPVGTKASLIIPLN